jgi:single-strand DNA-binding protein
MEKMNNCSFIGNLTRDVELRYSASGMAFAKSAIAVSHKFTSNGEKKESVLFLDFTVFGKSAETFNQYVRKGNKVALIGRLDFEQWTDNNNQKRSKHTLSVDSFEFLTPRDTNNAQNNQNGGYSAPVQQNQAQSYQPQPQNAPVVQYEQQQSDGSYQATPPPQNPNTPPSIDIDDDDIPF